MAPVNVNLDNYTAAICNLKKRYENNKRYRLMKKRKPKYSVGNIVRISKTKAAFVKGYQSGWSNEIFKISKISMFRQPLVYLLSDLQNEPIDGVFHEEELSLVK